ncbi:MAG: AtpZ/AtpI family protein [Clostridiales bacterium]|nr:AtpZ/AtpI family protein [Clostridiales bacterium]
MLIGVWVGKTLDTWLDTSPWLLLLFSLFGVGAAFKTMFTIISKDWKSDGMK